MTRPVRETAPLTTTIREAVGPEVEHRIRLEVGSRSIADLFVEAGAAFAQLGQAFIEAFAPLVAAVQRPPSKSDYALVPPGGGTVGRRPARHVDPLSRRPQAGPQVPSLPKRGRK